MTSPPNPPRAVAAPVLWAAALSLVLALGHLLPAARFFPSPAHYLPLHTVLELFAMAISAMVFALAWNLRGEGDNSHRLLLGCGFLAVCLIDLAHTLSYAGMPDMVTPSGAEKAINFWLAGRYVAAAVLLAVALSTPRHWSPAAAHAGLVAAVGVSGGIWWIGLVHEDWLPRTFIDGSGLTPFKVGAEYLLAITYGGAALLLLRSARRRGDATLEWLAAAAWVLGLAEMFFTLYADVTDLFNLLGHVYKAAAYLMVYRALFVAGVARPYRELADERSRLKTLLATIPDPVWLKDANGLYLACNAAFERFFGAREAAIVGRSDYDFVSREQADFFRRHDQAAMDRGGPGKNEEWLSFAEDGYHGLFETTKTPVRDADGRVVGVLGIAHDITERQRAEEALRISEERLLQAIRVADIGIFDHDHVRGLVHRSAEQHRVLGADGDDSLDLDRFLKRVHPDDRDYVTEAVRRSHDPAGDGLYAVTYRVIRPDGGVAWIEARGRTLFAQIDGQRRPLRTVGATLDISERKHNEDELRRLNDELEERVAQRTAELAESNRQIGETLATLQRAQDEILRAEKLAALGALVAGVAHELNTPIGNSVTVASTLLDDYREFAEAIAAGSIRRSTLVDFAARSREGLDQLLKNQTRAHELITSFKQVAVDQASEQRRSFYLGTTLSEIVATLTPMLKKSAHRLEVEVQPGIVMDSFPGPLAQVVTNLVTNALAHAFVAGVSGHMSLRASRCSSDAVRIEFADDGVGIPAELHKRIFDPFFTTRLGQGGSGLGLYIAHNLVTGVLGGSIGVDSAPGGGTRFRIELPLQAPAAAGAARDPLSGGGELPPR